ncbi:hypothetical protein FRC07_000903 [Ceratobasidium sp. 392]|nr:hypothetical protein FRC07_000903 [Ceratobasidium sp. 392]
MLKGPSTGYPSHREDGRMPREDRRIPREDIRTARDEAPMMRREDIPRAVYEELFRPPRDLSRKEVVRTPRHEHIQALSEDSFPRTPCEDTFPRTPLDDIFPRTAHDEHIPRTARQDVIRSARNETPRSTRDDASRSTRDDIIRTGRDEPGRPGMGARFTEPSVPHFRAPVRGLGLGASRGALGLDVSGSRLDGPSARTLDIPPPSAQRETFTSILARYDVLGPVRSVISPVAKRPGRRTSPRPVGRRAPSPVGRTAHSPVGRAAQSPVERRTAPSPVGRRTVPSPMGRMDRHRAMPEPYTDTGTDKDADARRNRRRRGRSAGPQVRCSRNEILYGDISRQFAACAKDRLRACSASGLEWIRVGQEGTKNVDFPGGEDQKVAESRRLDQDSRLPLRDHPTVAALACPFDSVATARIGSPCSTR